MQSRNINDDTRAREEMSQADETLSPDKNTSSEPRTGVIDEATSAGYDAVEPTFTKLIEHSHDADDALKALPSSEGAFTELDAANNKRLLRIIDRHLLPMMWIIYGIQFLDKLSLSYASVIGLVTDVGMTGNDYPWLSSVFYFGYLFWEYPTSRLLQRFPLAKYSSLCIILWGFVQCCHAGIVNYPGAITARIFLGAFEAAITPGFALFTSQWYTKEEQAFRSGIWFSANGIFQIVGGLLAYGILKAVERYGSPIAAWRLLFLCTGILTILLGVAFLFLMPDSQLNAKFLSETDRILAIQRIRVNQQGIGNRHFKRYQLIETLLDPVTWALFFFALVTTISNGGLAGFFNQVIKSFGYSTEQSLLLGTPAGAWLSLTVILAGWLGCRWNVRLALGSVGLWMAILGIALIIGLSEDHNVGRLVGYYLCWGASVPFVTLLSLVATNVAGYTKKTTVAASYLIGYCAGYIIGPQTFQAKDAPDYTPAKITMLCCWGFGVIDLYFILWYYTRENRKKAAVRALPGYVKLQAQEFLDLTDRENPEFVYVL